MPNGISNFCTGLVLFLEEDHYVAEDFMSILRLMMKAVREHCSKCNILSLGSYLKTYNYYGDSKNVSEVIFAFEVWVFRTALICHDSLTNHSQREAVKAKRLGLSASNIAPSWNFEILPTLYQQFQKVTNKKACVCVDFFAS